MAMGGGTFTVQNKTLPGSYINFVSTAGAVTLGERGIAALPLALSWGPEDQIYPLEAGDFNQKATTVFGFDPTAPALLLMAEALKRCSTLLVYRVNSGGSKAKAKVGGVDVTAKWGGTRGNDIRVAVEVNVDDDTKRDVVTYLDTTERDRQTVTAGGELAGNDFITFGTATTLTAAAAVPLAGGTDGAVTGESYAKWLTALEVEDFNALGYPGTDVKIKALVDAFVKRLRTDEGRKVVGVLFDHPGDDIGLINVKNGVVLTDGTVLSGDMAVAWVCAATAAAQVNESLTNGAYDGAVDVDIRYTKGQYEQAIKAGELVFYAEGGKARILSDINSCTTFGGGVSQDWSSNRVVRVMDGWANDVAGIFGQRYMGSQTNSETGRTLFKADLVALGKEYEGIDAISGFSPDDITVIQGGGKRDVAVACALTPNDSMEKLYMTVTVL